MRNDVDRKAFIKFSAVSNPMAIPPPAPTEERTVWKTKSAKTDWAFAVSSILRGSVVLNLVLIGAGCFVHRRSKRMLRTNSSSITGSVLRSFSYTELEEATRGFSEEVGKGAFGTVYKGVLPSQPRILIAVKKLEESLLEEAERDFANEVITIGHTHHRNLVQLLGFCKEGTHRLLVFEFMSNGPCTDSSLEVTCQSGPAESKLLLESQKALHTCTNSAGTRSSIVT